MPLAKIGKVEATVFVKHQVVRCREQMTTHLLVEQLCLASFRIDALHVAELIIRVWPEAHGMALDIATAPIVAKIEVAIGSDCQPIGPASAIGKQMNLAVGRHA